MEPTKTCTVIYNPVASRFDNALLASVQQRLKEVGYDVTVIKSNKAGHVVPLVKKYNPMCDFILTMGGDGTLGEAFQGYHGQPQHALYSHIGTGATNDAITNFGLSEKDPMQSLERILGGVVKEIDLPTLNGDAFAYVSAMGFMTNIPYSTPASLKRSMGQSGYVLWAMKEFAKKLNKIDITYTKDGEVIEASCILAIVSNSYRFAGVDIYKDISLNDGLFEVVILKYLTAKLIRDIFTDFIKNDIRFERYGDCFEIFHTDETFISFNNAKEKMDICNDGDRYRTERDEHLQLHYKIEQKVRMLLPE